MNIDDVSETSGHASSTDLNRSPPRWINFDDLTPRTTDDENPAYDCCSESLLEADSDAPPQSTTDESERSGDEDIDAILNAESKLIDQDVELKDFLADWLTKEDVSGAATDRFIKGLKALRRQDPTFTCLPNCSRTLLKTAL